MRMRKLILTLILCSACFGKVSPLIENFNTGQATPLLEGRSDFQKYDSANRILENMFVFVEGPATRRPGTRYIGQEAGELVEAYADYELTFISENGKIWGIPLDFSDYSTLTLDADDAVNVGGGIVGLPCLGHPFDVGDVIWIYGTSNYDNTVSGHTLTSGTTANELQFTATYNAETFDSTETVVQYIELTPSTGRMVQDSSGNLYYGRGEGVTKIETDGTIVTDFFTPDTAFGTGKTCLGLAITDDSAYLYVTMDEYRLWKFDLSDGSEVWSVDTNGGIIKTYGYNIAVDEDDNVYVCNTGTYPTYYHNVAKFAAADGAKSEFTDMQGSLDVVIDNDMGLIIVGGAQYAFSPTGLYNLATRTFDDSSGTQIALGDIDLNGSIYVTKTIGSECIVTYNDYIYVVAWVWLDSSDPTIYKLDSDLNVLETVPAETGQVPQGLFVDLQGQIVVVSQEWGAGKNDIFWYYDTDLNYLGKADGLYGSILISWAASVGGAYIQGNACFYPGLSLGEEDTGVEAAADSVIRLTPFEYSTDDSYVLAWGDEYLGFYRTIE